MEEGRRRCVRLNAENTTERKSVGNRRCTSLHKILGHQALTERQAKLHVADNYCFRRICIVKRDDRRKITEY